MAKAPRPGRVKTRLTKSIPVEAVTELYTRLLEDTITLSRSLGVSTSLDNTDVAIMCPATDVEELTRLTQSDVSIVAQKGEGLAAGLKSVFAHFTTLGRRVIAFNSDSPHLPPSILESAFDELATHDLVVGPTEDGGYYLVGAKAAHPTLFDGDRMGTKSALEALLARARELQLTVGFTDPFYDIDVEGDLTRLATELRLAPARAPRTAAWLKEWGQAVAQFPAGTGSL